MAGKARATSFSNRASMENFGLGFGELDRGQKLFIKKLYSRLHYSLNRDDYKERQALYRLTIDSIKRNEYQRNWRKLNPHKFRDIKRAWAKRHPLKAKFAQVRGGAKKREIPFEMTVDDFVLWHNSQSKVCVYCGIPENMLMLVSSNPMAKSLTIDRKDSDLGYRIDNLCLACFSCNAKKSDDIPFVVMVEIGERYLKPLWRKKVEDSNAIYTAA